MPGVLAHRGYSFRRIVDHLYLTGEGIFGIPLWVSSTFVFAFVLFGAIFERTGAGEYLMKLAMSLVGHTKGGPAKVSVVASAFMGTISGSGVATRTIGTLTIPEKGGLDRAAGGIERCRRQRSQPPSRGGRPSAEFLGIPLISRAPRRCRPIDQLPGGRQHPLSVKYGFRGTAAQRLLSPPTSGCTSQPIFVPHAGIAR
jgi:hypothetical protein